jgi:hypothetical protein
MLKKYISTFAIFLILISNSFAKVTAVRVMFNHNGSNQATIGWNQLSGEQPVVYISTTDFINSKIEANNPFIKPTTQNKFKGFHNYFVRLDQLKPNTAYYFFIKDSEGASDRYWFKTTSNDPTKRLSIIGGGDSRTRRTQRQWGFKMVGKLIPDAVMFDGDYTDIDTGEKWKYWFEDWALTYQDFDNRIIPIITTRGNHELTNKDLVNFFDCPAKNNAYNVTLGGTLVNIINLNTEISIASQRAFLKRTLENHKKFYWQIPQYHRACRPHVKWKLKHRIPKLIYKYWIPLLEKYGVRLVLECDSHLTKTTYPIKKDKKAKKDGGFVRNDQEGIVYVGEGCWGAPLRTPDVQWTWSKSVGKVDSFKWFWISQDNIEVRTVIYTNVDSIPGLTEQNRFTEPKGLKLWPGNQQKEAIIHHINCPK